LWNPANASVEIFAAGVEDSAKAKLSHADGMPRLWTKQELAGNSKHFGLEINDWPPYI
jgi:hypothetical protein